MDAQTMSTNIYVTELQKNTEEFPYEMFEVGEQH